MKKDSKYYTSCTATVYPALIRLFTILDPIFPKPMNPIFCPNNNPEKSKFSKSSRPQVTLILSSESQKKLFQLIYCSERFSSEK